MTVAEFDGSSALREASAGVRSEIAICGAVSTEPSIDADALLEIATRRA
jgi:hypothetical protein